MTVFRPSAVTEIGEIVTWAAAEKEPLEIVGGGSKRRLGRPEAAKHALDVSGISGIIDYEPSELVLTARAGTTMAEIEAQLSAHHQMLAFEPPDWRDLLASEGEPTLGGVVACNLAGPRRVRAGAPRDHFLGFSAVNGWGDAWKAGGRVVKNVTGYDMGKLQAGSYGTLSVLTELSVKVLPAPETSCSLVWTGLADQSAITALANALNSPHEVSAAAHLPAEMAARSKVADVSGLGANATVVRLEGFRPSVEYRAGALEQMLGPAVRLQASASTALWREIASVQPLLEHTDSIIWRVCPTPSAAPDTLRSVQQRLGSARGFFDWGGGLLWLDLDPAKAGADCGAASVRAAVQEAGGGHATLVRAPDPAREAVPVFEPLPPALDALTRRVKAGFDPQGVLNPGRMYRGM
ncbi:MAG: glycolate oxidase subunit GlcE [Pseudolabrys sp.]|nr:glycolate oxidase subunit GlcE [Pseudolabrys sp.]